MLIFPFFNPTVLQYIPATALLYDAIQVWKLLSIIAVILMYILVMKYSKIIILVLLYCVIYLSTSFINGVVNQSLITDALLFLGFAVLTEMAIKYNFQTFAKVMFNITFVLAVINFLSILLFPNGITFATLYTNYKNPHYFLAIDNGQFRRLLPLLFLSYYFILTNNNYIQNSSGKLRTSTIYVISIIMIGVTLILAGTATGIIIFIVFNVLFFFYAYTKLKSNYFILLIAYAVVFIAVVLEDNNISFIEFVANLFNRDANFTGRTTLWTLAKEMIIESPLIGYGNPGDMLNVWGGVYSSHNLILELALEGGLLLSGFFVVITIYSFFKLRYISGRFNNLIAVTIFSILLNGFMEVGVPFYYFGILVMACHCNEIFVSDKETVDIYNNAVLDKVAS